MKEGIGITRENRNGGVPDWFIRRKNEISAAQTDIVQSMIEYKIYELFHAANKKRLHQKEILLRQSQEDTEYLRNIFSVLLPERFIREIRMLHLRPPADPGVSRESIHLQLRCKLQHLRVLLLR